MRTRPLVASTVLTIVLALVALPGLVGSHTTAPIASPEAAAFQAVLVTATDRSPTAVDAADAAFGSADVVGPDEQLIEPGQAPVRRAAATRPVARQPSVGAAVAFKPARQVLHGYASFYDNGTTAMRLPRGTIVRICGDGGCVERVVNDYGPVASIRPVRIVDMYRPDFFAICGCGWWSGTTYVTVYVY